MSKFLPEELDPRSRRYMRNARIAGAAILAIGASLVVVLAGATLFVASAAAIIGIVGVNCVPVAARWAALRRQRALTHLAEAFSEETIREDERQEGDRVAMLEEQYKTNRAELEGAQEELRAQLGSSTEDERAMLNSQIAQLQRVIDSAEAILRQRKVDFEELKRVNKLYIAFARSAAAMEKGHGAVRNSEQFQRVETARASIKTRLRAQLAGQTIQAMNAQVRQKTDMTRVTQLGQSRSRQS